MARASRSLLRLELAALWNFHEERKKVRVYLIKRFALVDEPIVLKDLLDSHRLLVILSGVAHLHSIGVEVCDREGAVLGSIGPRSEPSDHRRALEYGGDVVGYLNLTTCSKSNSDCIQEIAEHLAVVLEALIDSAYGRYQIARTHEAAMKESFSELGDRNQRLASALERLEELDNLKSNFLATISHELRTPLTSIIGYSELIVGGMAGEVSKEQAEFVGTILSKADDLLQLITGILDVSLIEARALRLCIEPLSVAALLQSVAKTMRRDIEQRQIVLILPSQRLPRVLGDEGKLRQVILQLVANAIKFSPNGGEIRISVAAGALSPTDESMPNSPFWRGRLSDRFGLRVSIRDQGIGVAPDARAAIFEPFYQADSSSTRAFGGAGLGLSLAKSYVVAHGGFLWHADGDVSNVSSQSKSAARGSIFTFSVPAVSEELEDYVAAGFFAKTRKRRASSS